jgi:hypothetical protein
MKKVIFLSAFLIAIALSPCFPFSKSIEKDTRNLSGFKNVNFGISGELYINIGSEFKVVLEGEKSMLEKIETNISGDKLIIREENTWHFNNTNQKVVVYITMPELKSLGVSGSGMAVVKDPVKTDAMELSVSGSGKVFVGELEAQNLDCHISGSGDIRIENEGTVSKADLSISGSGNYIGDKIKIGSAEIGISGSGSCNCNVTGDLKANISGSGSVLYYGNPKIDARISGSGRVRSK